LTFTFHVNGAGGALGASMGTTVLIVMVAAPAETAWNLNCTVGPPGL
jgi:hypothetical protein